MKVLIGCEESQAVCIAFRERGFEAYSCDLQECSGGHPEWHLQMDVFEAIEMKPSWDLFIGFPPCKYLTNAGVRHFNIERYGESAFLRWENRIKAARFFKQLLDCNIPHRAIENPVGFMNGDGGIKSSQIIQPYFFGDEHSKRTCLWLRNLPPLIHTKTNNLFQSKSHVHKGEIGSNGGAWMNTNYILSMSAEDRTRARSKTFPGIAKAMAEQWGDYIMDKSFDNSRNKM